MPTVTKLKLEKDMHKEASSKGITFTEFLSEIDKGNYEKELSEMDAYQRQLVAYDIKINGKNASLVSDFFRTSDSSVLFPEFINRNLLIGLNRSKMEATVDDVISTTSYIDASSYKTIAVDFENSDFDYKRVSEASNFPRVLLKTKEKQVPVVKIGLSFESTYESIKFAKLNLVANLFQLIGQKLGKDIVYESLMVLLNGDGNLNPAADMDVKTSGTLTFEDLLDLEMAFENFESETLIGNKSVMKKVLLVSEFRDPLIASDFLTKGTPTTPFGNKLKINSKLPDGKLMAFNKKAGIEMLEVRAMSLIETDKIIDKQMEQTVISKMVGFNKIYADSAFVLNI